MSLIPCSSGSRRRTGARRARGGGDIFLVEPEAPAGERHEKARGDHAPAEIAREGFIGTLGSGFGGHRQMLHGCAGKRHAECFGARLSVREHRRIISIERSHYADSRGLIRLAWKLEALTVDEQGPLAIGYQRDVSEVSRSLYSRHIEESGKVSGGDAGGAKRQQDRHAGEFRIAGSFR